MLGLAVSGCAKDDEGDDTVGETGSDSSGDPSTASASATMSSTSASTTSPSDTTASSTADTTDSDPSTITVTTTEGPVEPQPNGESCTENEGCISALCFSTPLGGVCGECVTDLDCADITGGGCTIPNPLAVPPSGATCNMGEPGAGCMSDEICMGEQVCATILDVPGLLTASTCSECIDDTGCIDGALCSPSYDVLNLGGIKTCVQPGDVPDGDGCDLEGSGDEACNSGFCAAADVLGQLELGVCNPCEVDADCGAGEVCDPPTVDLMAGLVVGGCVPE